MRTLLATFLCLLTLACSKGEAQQGSPLTESSDGSRYVNAYFGLEVVKPAGWYAQDPEATMAMSARGVNMMAGDSKGMKALLDESLRTTLPIFAFFQHVPGAAVSSNPSAIAVAENIAIMPGIKSGCDYLFHVRQLLASSAMQPDISAGCQIQTVNGVPFGSFEVRTELGGRTVVQRYLACVQGEHALGVIQTYFNDSDKARVDAVVDSIKVSCS